MPATPLRIDVEEIIDFNSRFGGSSQLIALAIFNPAMVPSGDRSMHLSVCVQYHQCTLLPNGHRIDVALAPEHGVKFEDGTIRWRFTFPAFPPHNGGIGSQTLTFSAKAVLGRSQVAAAPTRTTIYYRH